MKPPAGMEEVYKHEDTIRRLLPSLKGNSELRGDAQRIMRGPLPGGTRLVHLRRIAKELQEAVQ